MAYDASYEWAQPSRWRRWVARVFALLALAACATGVYLIVDEATAPAASDPVTLQAEVLRVAASSAALGDRLEALERGKPRTVERARAALEEARGDRSAAAAAMARETGSGREVRDRALLANALDAQAGHLDAVRDALRRRPGAAEGLRETARRARAAWDALPAGARAGLPQTIRGIEPLTAFARRR